MILTKHNLADIIKTKTSVIGFWGAPPQEALILAAQKYPNLPFLDLDIFFDTVSSGTIPDAYCHIIRNCVDNALALGSLLKVLVATVGPEKCDAGRFAARLIEDMTNVEVIKTTNEKIDKIAHPVLCESNDPLKKRVIRIMESIIEPLDQGEIILAQKKKCVATHGFWGTPPHPIEVLDLFPPTTHVFGWTRCVEQQCPADIEIEMSVPKDLPIVFFSQGFCAKSMLAKWLADKYQGMYVDVHDTLNASTMAKIEAFIRLSVNNQDKEI